MSSASAGHAAGDLLPWTFPVSLAWCLMLGDDGQYLMTWCLIHGARCLMPQVWCLILVQCTIIIVRGTLVELGCANIRMVLLCREKKHLPGDHDNFIECFKGFVLHIFRCLFNSVLPRIYFQGWGLFFSAKATARQPRQTHTKRFEGFLVIWKISNDSRKSKFSHFRWLCKFRSCGGCLVISVGLGGGGISDSLRFNVAPISLRFLFDFILVSLFIFFISFQCHCDSSSCSLWFLFDLTLISLRFHFYFLMIAGSWNRAKVSMGGVGPIVVCSLPFLCICNWYSRLSIDCL